MVFSLNLSQAIFILLAQASKASDCEVLCCELESIRRVLAISKGGQAALSVVAMLAGSDYDIRGTFGVSSISSLRLIKFLLGPEAEVSGLWTGG